MAFPPVDYCNFVGNSAVLDDLIRDDVFPVPGRLRRLPDVPYLDVEDPRFRAFSMIGLDVDGICHWANPSDSIFRRNRQQLLTSFPILVPALAVPDLCDSLCFLEVSASIDRADPLIDHLSRMLNIGKGVIRYLMSLSPLDVGKDWISNPIQLFWAIRIVPETYRAKSADDWKTFHEYWCLSGLQDDADYWSFSHGSSRCHLKEHVFIQLCRNGYSNGARQRLRKMTNDQPNNVLLAGDYFDFVKSWCSDRYSTNIWSNEPGRSLAESLLMRYPLGELIRQSLQWHQDIHTQIDQCQTDDRMRSDSSLGSWPPLLHEPFVHGSLQAVSLVCAKDLADEGVQLNHCVGNYLIDCMTGQSHIISFRDPSGRSISTAEIVLDQDGQDKWRATCRQHYAQSNSLPSAECRELLELLILKLNFSESQSWLRQVQQIHDDRREEMEYHLFDARQAASDQFSERILRQILPDFEHALKWLEREFQRRQNDQLAS